MLLRTTTIATLTAADLQSEVAGTGTFSLSPSVIARNTAKPAIVMDMGTRYSKVGFVEDASPRAVIPTPALLNKDGTVQTEVLEDWIERIVYEVLQIKPKERRVIVCDGAFWNHRLRVALAAAWLECAGAAGILFRPAPGLALMSSGYTAGIVVDIGYDAVTITPVFELACVLHAICTWPAGASTILRRTQLLLEGKPCVAIAPGIEDVAARVCVVQCDGDVESKEDAPMVVRWNGNGVSLRRTQRSGILEPWFSGDDDVGPENTLADEIVTCLYKCAVDMRVLLVQNVLLVGGFADVPGFVPRLQLEVQQRLRKCMSDKAGDKVTVRVPGCAGWMATWFGGSVLGMVEPNMTFITPEQLQTGAIPDWTRGNTGY